MHPSTAVTSDDLGPDFLDGVEQVSLGRHVQVAPLADPPLLKCVES